MCYWNTPYLRVYIFKYWKYCTCSLKTLWQNLIYHINCGVIEGFPALRKAETTHVKKYRIFSHVDIANQLLTRHLPLASLGQVDEWKAKPSRIRAAKTLKNPYRWQTMRFKLLEGEKNQYTKRKTENYVFGGFGVGISLGWEWKSTNGRFATGRFLPFTWKTSSVGKNKVNEWEFCKLEITTIVVFVILIRRIFPS